MGDVLEYLVDGTSGLAPGGVDGKAMVAGVCSRGQVGKAYLLGPSSDLDGLLGTGPLVDRLRDVLATAGQEPTIVAVPVQGQQGGYISDPVWSGGNGSYPAASVSGVPQKNADVVVEVVSAGHGDGQSLHGRRDNLRLGGDGGCTGRHRQAERGDRSHPPAARRGVSGRRMEPSLPCALRSRPRRAYRR